MIIGRSEWLNGWELVDLVAADLHSFAPITQSIAGDGANTHGGGSPGAGVLDIHLGTSGVLDHQGGRGTGVGCGGAVGHHNFDFVAVGLVDGIPADLQPVLQGCDIARVIEPSFGDGGNADGCFRLAGSGRFGGGGFFQWSHQLVQDLVVVAAEPS